MCAKPDVRKFCHRPNAQRNTIVDSTSGAVRNMLAALFVVCPAGGSHVTR